VIPPCRSVSTTSGRASPSRPAPADPATAETRRRLAKALAALMGASAQTTPTGKRRTHAGKKRYTGVSIGGDPVDVWYDPANVREQ